MWFSIQGTVVSSQPRSKTGWRCVLSWLSSRSFRLIRIMWNSLCKHVFKSLTVQRKFFCDSSFNANLTVGTNCKRNINSVQKRWKTKEITMIHLQFHHQSKPRAILKNSFILCRIDYFISSHHRFMT